MPPEVSDIFARLETSKKDHLKTQTYVKLTKYQEFSWRTVGKMAKLRAKPNPKLELNLLRAHMRLRPEEYIAFVWMTVILVGVVMAIVAITMGSLFIAVLHIDAAFVVIFSVLLVLMPPAIAYIILMATPGSKAKTRARDIERHIGPAMSFISAMASADVNVDVIFKELSRQPIYGEIKSEAEWITRDTELLGIDILTAIGKAAQRTPSSKFQEFLQGVITTSTSGGQLKPYFLQKAEQFEKESKLDTRSQLETLGLMAETFVTVVVAFPLFLVVIMAIMAIMPGGGGNPQYTITMLWLVVLLIIPISQFGFIFFIWNSTKESSL